MKDFKQNTTNERTTCHAEDIEELLYRCEVEPEQGLSHSEAQERLQRCGSNELRVASSANVWLIFLRQFRGVVILLMTAAALTAFLFAQWAEGAAVLAVLIVNILIAFVSEWKATRSMEALRDKGMRDITLRREGEEISTSEFSSRLEKPISNLLFRLKRFISSRLFDELGSSLVSELASASNSCTRPARCLLDRLSIASRESRMP